MFFPPRPAFVKVCLVVAVLLLGALLFAPGFGSESGAPAADNSIPDDLRADLESVLQEKVKALLAAKNEDGQPYKRATYSKDFKKVDESTYQVSFHRDTASKDKLLTERFLLTLKSDAKGKWSVASEELKDSFSNLTRGVAGDEQFFTFGKFTFEKEGLKVSASGGSLFKDFRDGQLDSLTLAAKNITYEYRPPETKFNLPSLDPRLAMELYEKLKRDHGGDVIFQPEYITIECDPAALPNAQHPFSLASATSCEELMSESFTGLSPAKVDSVDPRVRDKYEQRMKDRRKARKENPFAEFRLPADADHKYWHMTLARDNPDRRVGIEYDNYEPRDVSYWAYGLDKFSPSYDKVYHYYSTETVKSGVSPHDLEMREDPEARDYDLIGLKGTAEFALEDSETLSADLTYTLKTKRELREIPFFISRLRESASESKESKAPQLIINSIEDGDGKDMTWVKLGASFGLVILPSKVRAGTPVVLHMQFENKAGIYALTPTYSYVSRFGWMPFVRFTDMINDFDLTLKVPGRYKALGIGRKVSEKVEKGVQVTRWVADSPVEFPSVIFGDYIEAQSSVKATRADGAPVTVTIHVDKLGKTADAQKYMEDIADQAANSLNLYREIYGVDYPYGKLDLVNDPAGPPFYGQSPSSLIYLGSGVFLGSGGGAITGNANISKFNREVIPHEVGHQWWGSLIPNFNDGNYWFVESLAEYSAALYVQESQGDPAAGRKAYQEKVSRWRRVVLDSDLQSSVQDASVLWSGALGSGYTAAVYNKGPYAFHIMRMTWGDEKFFKFLKMLAQELKNRAIVTRDIQKVAEKAFSGSMDFFFDQWLRGVGLPEYTMTYGVRQTEDGKYIVEGDISQRVLVGSKKDLLEGEYFTAIVPVWVTGKDGKERRWPVKVQGPKSPFKFKMDEKPKTVIFNKYGESLAYDVIVKETS